MKQNRPSKEDIEQLLLEAAEHCLELKNPNYSHEEKLAWVIGWLIAQLGQDYATNWDLQRRIHDAINRTKI